MVNGPTAQIMISPGWAAHWAHRYSAAELAIALVAMWQLEAVQTVGDGTGGVIDAATIAEEQNFMEFTIPDLGD